MTTATASIFPTPYMVCHIARNIDTGDVDPDTGNPKQVDLPPVIRWVQAISQVGRIRGSSEVIVSPETVNRVKTDLHLTVPDPQEYAPEDQVILFPEVDANGDYVPGTGIAFWVDGLPVDQRMSPWPQLFKIFGGLIRIRRA